jgi:formylglycine-generating enzyme
MRAERWVWMGPLVGGVAVMGCAQLWGLDKEYRLVEDTETGGSGGGVEDGGGSVCKPESKQCAGNTPQTCDASGVWQGSTGCSAQTEICVAGGCVIPPSCAGLPATCGPKGDELCCAITSMPGGSYNRSNDPEFPATVSSFRLDRFEVTVGRFRKFVAAYPGSKPKAGDGAHPLIAGSGWDAAWDAKLPVARPALIAEVKCDSTSQTWTDAASANENLPMNCLSWYAALAFCAWDGGRLPTEAEWNYAAAGGDEQRTYPWGPTAPDAAHAVFYCTGDGSVQGSCAFADILKVGSKPAGDGKWGQADLGGSMWEWNLDWFAYPYPDAFCKNCANTKDASDRVLRGGGWSSDASDLLSSGRNYYFPTDRVSFVGARCARTP